MHALIKHAEATTYTGATATAVLAHFDWHAVPMWISATATVCGVVAQIAKSVAVWRSARRLHELQAKAAADKARRGS